MGFGDRWRVGRDSGVVDNMGFFSDFLGDGLFHLLDDLGLLHLAGGGVLEEDDDHD